MPSDVLMKTAEQLATFCREENTIEGLDTLYDPDAVSVEAMAGPGSESRETVGVPAIKGKHEWWTSNMEVHSSSLEGPFPHGDDRFAIIFDFDATEKATGKRMKMREVAVYTINPAGKIVREEFFYAM